MNRTEFIYCINKFPDFTIPEHELASTGISDISAYIDGIPIYCFKYSTKQVLFLDWANNKCDTLFTVIELITHIKKQVTSIKLSNINNDFK